MKISRRRPPARRTSVSRLRATSDLVGTGGRYFVAGVGGVGVPSRCRRMAERGTGVSALHAQLDGLGPSRRPADAVAALNLAKLVAELGGRRRDDPPDRAAIARSMIAATSSGSPVSRRSGTGWEVIRRNWATTCSPLRRSNAACPVSAQNSVAPRRYTSDAASAMRPRALPAR